MVPGVNPVIELVKIPVPVPSIVLLSAMVGFGLVLQHTPLTVIEAPPSFAIVPPPVAVVEVRFVTTAVVSDGITLVVSFSQEKAKTKRTAISME